MDDIQFGATRNRLPAHGHRRLKYLCLLVMNAHFKQKGLQYAGREYRVNPSRFFM